MPEDEPRELERTRADEQADEVRGAGDPDQTLPDDGHYRVFAEAWVDPEQIGRYVVQQRLGAGAMGVVYQAHDPRTDRQVAIKLLKGRCGETQRLRLHREAQALAQLSHPNVVQVFEVGVLDEHAYLVMELVEGQDLHDWLAAQSRSVHEVLALFVQAAAGLEAAHDAGFVHRDVKPSNVLVGSDGRVRVVDFGLARASAELVSASKDERASQATGERNAQVWSQELTRTGTMMGTPAYMAPEQLSSQPATPASDQFGFCVALYEALYRQHPFVEPGQMHNLLVNVLSGQLREPPEAGVPHRVRVAVLRGLSLAPRERWPSLSELREQLVAAMRRPRWSSRLGALTLAAAVGGAAWLALMSVGDEKSVCRGASTRLAEVWGPSQHVAVERALMATKLHYAGATWQRVAARLDAYADDWASAYAQACRAGLEDGTQLDQRMACLERRRESLELQVEILASADASVVEQAVVAVGGLEAPQGCLESGAESSRRPADARLALKYDALMLALLRIEAFVRWRKFSRARALVESAREQCEALGDPALEARVWLVSSMVEGKAGDYALSLEQAERAYFLAREAGEDRVALDSALSVFAMVGIEQQDYERGLEWARHAEVEVERSGGIVDRGTYLATLGVLREGRREHDLALPLLEEALRLQRSVLGPEDLQVADRLSELAVTLRRLGRADESIEHYEQALAIYEQVLGPEHPAVARLLRNLAAAQHARGRLDVAAATVRRALSIGEAALGPDHVSLVTTLNNLSVILSDLGHYEEAEAAVVRAVEITERTGAQKHNLGVLIGNLASMQSKRGDLRTAVQTHRRAVAVFEDAGLGEHPDFGHELILLATVLEQLGQLEEADALLRRALPLFDRATRGSLVARAIRTLSLLARVSLARGRRQEAIDYAERGLERLPPKTTLVYLEAVMQFVLAQAHGGDTDEALVHARAAEHAARKSDHRRAQALRREIEAWRAEHDPTVEVSAEPAADR